MTTLTALHEQRGVLVTSARAALNEINANTDDARAAELTARHDAIMAEFDALDVKIAREERVSQAEAKIEEFRSRHRPLTDGQTQAGGGEDNAPTYRDAFYAMLAAGGDTNELSPEMRTALRTGRSEIRAQSTAAAAGGYTVPVELFNEVIKSMKDWGPMLDGDVARVLRTSSGNQITMPTVNDTAKIGGLHTEAGTVTDDGSEDVVFGQRVLDAFFYDTEWLRISMELLMDSTLNVESFIGELLGERLARRGNAVLTTGTGSGQPNGIVTAATLGRTAVSATALTADELIDLQHSVNAAYRRSPKARFMFADTTLQAIRKLKDGQGNYLFQMGDIRVGAPPTLLDKPYSINDDMATIATGVRSVIFGDFSRYFVRIVGQPVVGVVRERFYPDLGMLGLIRLDGELADTAAVKYLAQA